MILVYTHKITPRVRYIFRHILTRTLLIPVSFTTKIEEFVAYKWVLEFVTKDTATNPLMGWESSTDTLDEVILKFPTKEKAIEYAKMNDISYTLIKPNKKKFIMKSYADNFLKN